MKRLFSGDRFGGGADSVQAVIFGGFFAGAVGVAVGAPVRASVVFADVLAGDTAAERPLPLVLRAFPGGCFRPEQTLPAYAQKIHQKRIVGEIPDDQLVVDTFVVPDAELRQVDPFAACGQRITPLFVQLRQSGCHVGHLLFVELAAGGGVSPQPALHTAVGADVRKTENQLFGVSTEQVADPFRFAQQLLHTGPSGQDQRVEPPDDQLFAQQLRKPEEGLDTFVERRHAALEPFGFVVVERVVEVAADALFAQFLQVRKQRAGILRPEDDEPRPGVGNIRFHAVERVRPDGISLFQPVEKPVGVECRNVRGTACRDDHGRLRPHRFARLRRYVDRLPDHDRRFRQRYGNRIDLCPLVS